MIVYNSDMTGDSVTCSGDLDPLDRIEAERQVKKLITEQYPSMRVLRLKVPSSNYLHIDALVGQP